MNIRIQISDRIPASRATSALLKARC